MSYFDEFPKLLYPYGGSDKVVTNITRGIRINRKLTDEDVIYFPYEVKDGERPERVSARFYDTEEYYWVIFLVNDIINVYEQWAMSDTDLEEYIEDKYGETSDDPHHYVNSKGFIVPQPAFGAASYEGVAVSNRQFELEENEKKRSIRVVDPRFIREFKRQFETLMLK